MTILKNSAKETEIITNDIFYDASTPEKFNKVVHKLKDEGYEWVGLNKNLSFSDCKKAIYGNAKLIIHAFYNTITNKKDMQFGTKSIYQSYPQHKKIKITNI